MRVYGARCLATRLGSCLANLNSAEKGVYAKWEQNPPFPTQTRKERCGEVRCGYPAVSACEVANPVRGVPPPPSWLPYRLIAVDCRALGGLKADWFAQRGIPLNWFAMAIFGSS